MPNPRTFAATAAHQQRAAERAAADPVRRGRALRAVRAALAQGTLSFADILGHGSNVVELRHATPPTGGDAA